MAETETTTTTGNENDGAVTEEEIRRWMGEEIDKRVSGFGDAFKKIDDIPNLINSLLDSRRDSSSGGFDKPALLREIQEIIDGKIARGNQRRPARILPRRVIRGQK